MRKTVTISLNIQIRVSVSVQVKADTNIGWWYSITSSRYKVNGKYFSVIAQSISTPSRTWKVSVSIRLGILAL